MTAQTKALQVVEMPERTRHPTPPLATSADVRREMATLYREARSGRLDVADASKLTFILVQIAQVLRIDDLEQRTAALERALRLQSEKAK
ncbi:hypothetical protein [Thiomonas intermedia]|uniref:hypothetical protein n=1 Tax=Thiomonas intermedia TaxID=926 RepID=UPI001FE4A194|nr:hypothetical protein [Thiomonas intermedia]